VLSRSRHHRRRDIYPDGFTLGPDESGQRESRRTGTAPDIQHTLPGAQAETIHGGLTERSGHHLGVIRGREPSGREFLPEHGLVFVRRRHTLNIGIDAASAAAVLLGAWAPRRAAHERVVRAQNTRPERSLDRPRKPPLSALLERGADQDMSGC
jgi:hypothetical protein